MVKEITPDQLPPDQKKAFDNWLGYFRNTVDSQPFYPADFQGEDKNMLALRSKEEFISWYGQPPGKVQEPYRDECFYTRELTWLSSWCQPEKVVEFGTDKGIGTLILSLLNPSARIHTIDNRPKIPMPPNDGRVEPGIFARKRKNAQFWMGDSKHFQMDGMVGLCFIDGDHSQEGVWNDSLRAWSNRNMGGRWAIIWHDYRETDEMRGLKMAINRFSDLVRKRVYKFSDSATVWITSED